MEAAECANERASGRASERAGGRAQEGLAETKDPAVAETESPGEERHHLEGGVWEERNADLAKGGAGREDRVGGTSIPAGSARRPAGLGLREGRGEAGGRACVRGRQGALGPAPVAACSPAPGPAARGPAKSGQALSPS